MSARTPAAPPVALTIAGSDNSAGAGIQADLKTFTAHGVYGLTALTCLVAEIPGRVSCMQRADLPMIRSQLELSIAAYPVAAIKTGMLLAREVVALVADWYEALPAPRPPLVVDPVMVASSGARLLEPDAIAAYGARLIPLATLVTPNLDEARVLAGEGVLETPDDLREAGSALCARYGAAFLMKGGHFGGELAVDWLCLPDGRTRALSAPFTRGMSTHGTGCTYSAAIAAGLACGLDLEAAAVQAKAYISRTVAQHFRWESGSGWVDALNHWPVS